MFEAADKEFADMRSSVVDLAQVVSGLSQTITAQNTVIASLRVRIESLEGKPVPVPPPAPIPVPVPAPPGIALTLPKITAPSSMVGVELSRVMATMPAGWTPYQGRWYIGDKEIGGQAKQSTTGLPSGSLIVYREWWNNAAGQIEVVSSLPFGPLTDAVTVSGASTVS